ncbi:MAG: hydrolase TatD [Gammaproteobacteria bacterium]|nr:hydrolase TatD [Gammaproteobacteria bacterium]
MTAAFVDIGINLTHDSYDHDREEVLRRALAAGVVQFVVTGASADGSRAALALARAAPTLLRATAGCHPHHAFDFDEQAYASLIELAADPLVAAIGETGLDYHRNFSAPREQRLAFERQVQLACRLGKPLFLHERDAHGDFLAVLREHRSALPAAVLHCFTGTAAQLEACLEFGLHIGITGWICDERRGLHLRDLVHRVPQGRLMIETDGPYLLPRDLDPKPASRRNEPMYLPHIARVIADCRKESLAELAAHTTATAQQFFDLPCGNLRT